MSSCVILENRLEANRFAIVKWISVRSIGKWFMSVDQISAMTGALSYRGVGYSVRSVLIR